ncbi:hypothetical protein CBL_11619 [Carabus blaptoides fortunei]
MSRLQKISCFFTNIQIFATHSVHRTEDFHLELDNKLLKPHFRGIEEDQLLRY